MPSKAYLVLTFSTGAYGPIISQIYSEYPLTVFLKGNNFQLLVAEAEGNDFEDARNKLIRKIPIYSMGKTIQNKNLVPLINLSKVPEPKNRFGVR